MPTKTHQSDRKRALRKQAVSRLTDQVDQQDVRMNEAAALGILHDLASSPATADASLKLLHELQVHQVELDLQEEELRRAVAHLETALFRQSQLHDFAPAGCFTIEPSTAICELNRTGARLLHIEREAAVGCPLDSFLDPASSRALHSAIARVAEGAPVDGCTVRLAVGTGAAQAAYASVAPDPSGPRFLVACVEIR
jgi:PAS domain-containing protein